MALIDLGAGNCAKAARLFPLLEPQRYVAVDISVEFLRDALRRAAARAPAGCDIVGLGQDFSTAARPAAELLGDGAPVFFYPGSSIGNFTPDEALAFLRRVRARASGGGLLIGVDLVKPRAVLEAAYDDALGVTAAFNRNALRHLNRLIGSDFVPRHGATSPSSTTSTSRIEMHLEAREPLERLAGPAAIAASPPASASTPRTRASTRSKLRRAADRRRLRRAAGAGPIRTAGSPCSGAAA